MAKMIEGIFLLEKNSKIGTGSTEKQVKNNMYCIAKQINDDEIEVCYLSPDDKPTSIIEKIDKTEFLHSFTFQPYYLEKKEAERLKKVNKFIATAEEHVKRDELHSAEYEFSNALRIDEENLRANFGIGNVYLKMGEMEKAKDVFVKISRIDAIFEENNKHFFNECGIQLRKHELYDEAIEYYEKAFNLSPRDENLCFNLARAFLEKGDRQQAKNWIDRAFAINPDYEEGRKFLAYMEKL